MMKNQLFFLTHYFKSIKIDSWCVWQDRCFPLLDTRRIGHQVFTALTLDSFCLLLIHITKEKKKKREHSEDQVPQSSQSSSELQVKPSPTCQATHSWGKVQFSEVHVPGTFQNFPEIPPTQQETPTALQEQLPQFRTFPALFLMGHKAFFWHDDNQELHSSLA